MPLAGPAADAAAAVAAGARPVPATVGSSSSAAAAGAAAAPPAPSQAAPLFLARVPSASVLSTLLLTLRTHKDSRVLVEVLPAGIKFTVEGDKTMRSRIYFRLPSLSLFQYAQQHVAFSLPLDLLIKMLQVFAVDSAAAGGGGLGSAAGRGAGAGTGGAQPGAPVPLELLYEAVGSPLLLRMTHESGCATECGLRTLEPDDVGPLQGEALIKGRPMLVRAVCDSALLREFLSDVVAVPGAEEVELVFNPPPAPAAAAAAPAPGATQGGVPTQAGAASSSSSSSSAAAAAGGAGAGGAGALAGPPLVLARVYGVGLALRVDLPPTKTSPLGDVLFSEYVCAAPQAFVYSMGHVQACLRGLMSSQRALLRVHEGGTLVLHNQVRNPYAAQRADGDSSNWVEIMVAAKEDDDVVVADHG